MAFVFTVSFQTENTANLTPEKETTANNKFHCPRLKVTEIFNSFFYSQAFVCLRCSSVLLKWRYGILMND